MRRIIRISRNRLNPSQIEDAGRSIKARALKLVVDFQTVACYISVRTEPPTLDLVEELYQQGRNVLIPELGSRLNRDWSYYRDKENLADLSPNRPKEPPGGALGSLVLIAVEFVFTPALTVDWEGNRLEQGGDWYDRALPYAKTGTPVFALLYSNELLDNVVLPTNKYDYPMTGVATPNFAFELAGSLFQAEDILPTQTG